MDTKINFFRIGLFVSIISFLLFFTIFWLGKYGLESKKYDLYSIYFSESISGLNIGSSIKYMGFDVGVVKNIKINPNNSEEIQIDIEIQKNTPIKEDNFAILGNLGITGLKYIELKGGSNHSKLLEKNENGIKVIPSKKSILSSLADSTEDITRQLTILLAQVKKLLSEDNLSTFSSLLVKSEKSMQNIEEFSSYLAKNKNQLDELILNMKVFANSGNTSFNSVRTSADKFKEFISNLQIELQKGSFDIKNLTQDSFDSLEMVLKGLDSTINQTQELIKNINESPSDLLLKQKNIKYGPGETNEK